MKVEFEGSDWQVERFMVEWLTRERKLSHVILVREGDDPLGSAWGMIEHEYRADVKGIVVEVRKMICDRELTTQEEVDEWLRESVDGSQRVIYTRQAAECVLVSKNDGVAFEEGLLDADDMKDGIDWSALAYWAFLRDIEEELGDVQDLIDEAEEAQADPPDADDGPKEPPAA